MPLWLKPMAAPREEMSNISLIKTIQESVGSIRDIILSNSKIIKLPVENFDESLSNYKSLRDSLNFDKYTIFDYRIKDQLILN